MLSFISDPFPIQRPVNDVTAFVLRMTALITMLIDHLYVKLFPNQLWMHCIGRLAFPIFAFQLTNGYQKTGNKPKYAIRLLLFAVLSEIPFDFMTYSKPFFWGHQNVLWTLLLGLFVIWTADWVITRWCDLSIRVCAIFCTVVAASSMASLLQLDYGGPGILLIFSLYMLRNRPLLAQTFSVLCICLLMGGPYLNFWDVRFPVQILGTLAMIPIGLYNGQPGPRSKVWSRFCYLFYPLHLLVLSFF